MKLLGNRVLVEPFKRVQFGTIILPEGVDTTNIGDTKVWRVKDVGPGRRTKKGHVIPIECVPGDLVVTHSYTEGAVESDLGLVINANIIIAVIPLLEQ